MSPPGPVGVRKRLLLAEDHELVGAGFRALLERDYEVVGPVRNGSEVLGAVRESRPDVLLLDLSLPGRNGMDLIPDVRRESPATAILVVTMHADYVIARTAVSLGALGFIPKDSRVEELREAVDVVLQGRPYISPRIPAHEPVATTPTHRLWINLTTRQQEIMRCLAEGKTSEDIAELMGLSVHTVSFHRRNIRRVLGIESESGLVRAAVLMGVGSEGRAAHQD